MSKKIRFEKCDCTELAIPHGYFNKVDLDSRLPVVITSLVAGRYLMSKLPIEFGEQDQVDLEQQIIAAGLPKRTKDDIKLVKYSFEKIAQYMSIDVLDKFLSAVIEQAEKVEGINRLRRQAEMN